MTNGVFTRRADKDGSDGNDCQDRTETKHA
jgi:hypothetical protein